MEEVTYHENVLTVLDLNILKKSTTAKDRYASAPVAAKKSVLPFSTHNIQPLKYQAKGGLVEILPFG